MSLGNAMAELRGLIREVGSREYFREGAVVKIDLTGNDPSNLNRIAPAVKIDVAGQGKGDIDRPPFWLRLAAAKRDNGGNVYFPPDLGARVLIACPGGVLHKGIVLCALSSPPESAGTTTKERNNRSVVEFGDLRILMNRAEGEEEITLTMPGSADGEHLLTLRRKIDSRGIVLQTAGGHYLVFQDLEKNQKVELAHSLGTRITFERDGSWTAIIVGDKSETITGDREATVDGDDTLTVGKNQTETIGGDKIATVTGSITYTASKGVTINGLSLDLNSNTTVNIRTAVKILVGLVSQATQPTCNYNGAPLGCTINLKAGV